MRLSRFLILGTLVLSFPTGPGIPAGASAESPTEIGGSAYRPNSGSAALEEYFSIRRVGRSTSFSHDETMVAYLSDEGGRFDVYVQPTSGGLGRRITRVDGRIHSFAFSPTADVLLFEADEGGDEKPRLYLTDSQGRSPRDLTPRFPKGSRIGFIAWAADGQSLLYITNLPGEAFTTIREFHLGTGRSESLWKSTNRLSFSMTSPDFQRFILQETLSDANSNLYLFDRSHPEPVLLTPHEKESAYTPTGFSPDGKTLYYTATGEGEFATLHSMELSGRKAGLVLGREWDVRTGYSSTTGLYFVTVTNVDGVSEVRIRNTSDGKNVLLPEPPPGGVLVPSGFSRTDRYLSALLESETSPRTLFVVDMAKQKARQLVDVLPESLRHQKMVAGQSLRIPSFDDRKVPAILYSPAGEGPFPAVIDVHGGPTAQSKRRFSALRQYLVSRGYVLLAPNVRGSSGYGKTYSALDNMDLGGGPLKDIIACKKWLVERAGVDKDRVAIMGASYGGYMALAAAAFTPGEFAAHVDYFGFSDLKSLVESYPAYWAVYASWTYKKYGDPKNPAHAQYQHDRSPIHFVDRIQGPLLVVQGANDIRVPRDQSDRIVRALRRAKRPVHYLLFLDEGHGFTKTKNRLTAYQTTDRFLHRYLFHDASVRILP